MLPLKHASQRLNALRAPCFNAFEKPQFITPDQINSAFLEAQIWTSSRICFYKPSARTATSVSSLNCRFLNHLIFMNASFLIGWRGSFWGFSCSVLLAFTGCSALYYVKKAFNRLLETTPESGLRLRVGGPKSINSDTFWNI